MVSGHQWAGQAPDFPVTLGKVTPVCTGQQPQQCFPWGPKVCDATLGSEGLGALDLEPSPEGRSEGREDRL